MFEFQEKIIYTGSVIRKSKKTDLEYTLVNFFR